CMQGLEFPMCSF
nr:immunoglobulin light chain junction region [Macaca mulatta]